jgi:hypothetical protein
MVRMWMWLCGQAKLLDQIRTHQIVAAPSINNHTCSTVLDDEENLEQAVALKLLGRLNLCANNTLHNNVHVARSVFSTKYMALGVVSGGIIFLYVRGADVTAIASRHICPLTWTILLHMAKSMVAVALNVGSVSRRSHR